MPVQLLPSTAAAFAPRASSVNVVLGSKVEPWLTQTLKRVNRVKRPLNSVAQHHKCLTEILSSTNAIWTLASIMLPRIPDADMSDDLEQTASSYQLVHIEAYVVHVDMVLRNEVGFKLTKDTIEALVEYHEEIHCANAKASTYHWSEKEQQCKKLHDEFIQAINKYVFRAHASALEGLEEEGYGELLNGQSEVVKNNILGLMKPLLPPPPRVVEVVRQQPLLPSSPMGNIWMQPTTLPSNAIAVDSWRILPTSPSLTSTSAESTPVWASMTMNEYQLPSPTPSFSQPHSTAGYFFNSPQAMMPMTALPLPSMLASSQCGFPMNVNMGMNFGGMTGFGWDHFPDFQTIM